MEVAEGNGAREVEEGMLMGTVEVCARARVDRRERRGRVVRQCMMKEEDKGECSIKSVCVCVDGWIGGGRRGKDEAVDENVRERGWKVDGE